MCDCSIIFAPIGRVNIRSRFENKIGERMSTACRHTCVTFSHDCELMWIVEDNHEQEELLFALKPRAPSSHKSRRNLPAVGGSFLPSLIPTWWNRRHWVCEVLLVTMLHIYGDKIEWQTCVLSKIKQLHGGVDNWLHFSSKLWHFVSDLVSFTKDVNTKQILQHLNQKTTVN